MRAHGGEQDGGHVGVHHGAARRHRVRGGAWEVCVCVGGMGCGMGFGMGCGMEGGWGGMECVAFRWVLMGAPRDHDQDQLLPSPTTWMSPFSPWGAVPSQPHSNASAPQSRNQTV